mgnify:CR=1 FL=1
MKKLLVIALMAILLTGCGSDKLKEGTFEGSAIDTYGGEENTATAKVTIDSEGKITDVYLDTTYTKDGVETTKKTLGDEYGMKTGNSEYGSAEYEWYEQVEALEKAVIDNQGIDYLNLDEDGYTDADSTCTIKIDALYKALEDALNKAK